MTTRKLTSLLLAAALLAAACTPIEEQMVTPAITQSPDEAAASISPDQQAIADATVTWTAEQLGVAAEEVALVSMEAMEWPDASLGCPQPEMLYAAVITPGYQVTIRVQDTTYSVHTDSLPDGEKIICAQ